MLISKKKEQIKRKNTKRVKKEYFNHTKFTIKWKKKRRQIQD